MFLKRFSTIMDTGELEACVKECAINYVGKALAVSQVNFRVYAFTIVYLMYP